MTSKLVIAESSYPHPVEILADDVLKSANDCTEAEQAIGCLLSNLSSYKFDESFINAVLDLISEQK